MKYYIPLPEGIEHAVINGQDHLIDKINKVPAVNMQFLIKEHLRNPHKGKHQKSQIINTSLDKVKIYTAMPPALDMDYLVYEPKNNGALPSDKIERLKSYKNTSPATNPAGLFNGHAPSWMNNAKRKQLEEKRDEQRENRRHMGDSPKST